MSSKIPEATDKIKKKLSFNDVKPVYQQNGETTNTRECIFSPIDEADSENLPVHQRNDKPLTEFVNLPLDDHKEGTPVNQSDINLIHKQKALLVSQPASKEASHINNEYGESITSNEVKKKATYYLTEKAHKLMDEMFIKSIAMGKKKDKSALACEAIELLYQKEMR